MGALNISLMSIYLIILEAFECLQGDTIYFNLKE